MEKQTVSAVDETQQTQQKKQTLFQRFSAFADRHYTLIYAFIIVVFIYFLASFVHGVYPFGNKYTAASYDLSAQICPFIEHIFDVLQGKSTFSYSYAIAGGADVTGTFLYFFISPFSFLFLLFGDGKVAHASSIVIGLKLGTIALAGTWFAKKVFDHIPDFLCISVGVVYAYCGYTFVSNTYINWMDFLIYLPFAIAAFKHFTQTGKFWLFSVLMACCIYTCFSIACFSMFTVFPALIFYGLLCVKKEERNLFLTRLCLSFVVAIAASLPVLLPALKAYLASGRTGTLFENFWFGAVRDANGNITDIAAGTFIDKIKESSYRKFSYVFSDTAFLALTIVWFFRTGLKKPFAKFMLIAGVMTMIPVLFDESMLLMNMGSYMSYALRFGFLNAAYMLGGACLALDGLCYELHKDRTGEDLSPIIRVTAKHNATDEEVSTDEQATVQEKKTLIGGSKVWFVVFAIVFLAAFCFLAWWVSGDNYQTFLHAITDNSEILSGIEGFAGSFAHSLGGMEIIVVPVIVVAVLVFFGAILVWRKKLGARLVAYALIAVVGLQVTFYNNALVQGNRSTQHVGLGAYEQLCETLNEMNTDPETGELAHFRVKDYGDRFTAPAPFTGNANSFSVFSSVIDKDNFIIGELFGYKGNFKNSLKSAHDRGKANRSDEFGDSFLGYKYFIVQKGDDKKRLENSDAYIDSEKKYIEKVMVLNELGEPVHLSCGDYYVYENKIVFPSAFKVDSGEFRFVQPNDYRSANRRDNQAALFEFLCGESLSSVAGKLNASDSRHVTPETARYLSEYLWDKSASKLSVGQGKICVEITAKEGECLMLPFVASNGYRVFVNGQETQLIDNDLKFLCVALDEGENTVKFVYKSPYPKYMLVGLFLAVSVILALYFVIEKTSLLREDAETLKKPRTILTTMIAWAGILLAAAVVSFFMVYPSAIGITKWMKYFTLS